MSYCRFSSMNWRCDVYVIEDTLGGWTTHVAASRRMFSPIPDLTWTKFSQMAHVWSGVYWDKNTRTAVYPYRWRGVLYRAWGHFLAFWHNHVHMLTLNLIPMRAINGLVDGEVFNDPTPGECADRLEWLRGIGYNVPDYAIAALREEQKEMSCARLMI